MKVLIILLTASLFPVNSLLLAQELSEKKFLKLEQAWTGALAGQDSVRLNDLLSPDFTLIGAGAVSETPIVTRENYMRNALRFQWPGREVEILHVSLQGSTAVVRCVWRGADPPPFSVPEPEGGIFEFLLTDVWIQDDNGWHAFARHSSYGYAFR